jgi:hypothetical protein
MLNLILSSIYSRRYKFYLKLLNIYKGGLEYILKILMGTIKEPLKISLRWHTYRDFSSIGRES